RQDERSVRLVRSADAPERVHSKRTPGDVLERAREEGAVVGVGGLIQIGRALDLEIHREPERQGVPARSVDHRRRDVDADDPEAGPDETDRLTACATADIEDQTAGPDGARNERELEPL